MLAPEYGKSLVLGEQAKMIMVPEAMGRGHRGEAGGREVGVDLPHPSNFKVWWDVQEMKGRTPGPWPVGPSWGF